MSMSARSRRTWGISTGAVGAGSTSGRPVSGCDIFWGSHGCDREDHAGDPQRHECGTTDPDGPCSELIRLPCPPDSKGFFPALVRYYLYDVYLDAPAEPAGWSKTYETSGFFFTL
jgi:hypothetical protein